MSGQRNRVGDRLGLQISHKKNIFNRNFKVGGLVDKGKRAHVRSSKRRPSYPTCMNGKLILEKKKVVSGSAESWTSTSDSELEEGQFRNFGLEKGECSRFKSKGFGPKHDGLLKKDRYSGNGLQTNSGDGLSISFGVQDDGNLSSCGNGLLVPNSNRPYRNSYRNRAASAENAPKQIFVRNSEQRVVSLSDSEGRLMSLPLKDPIQLPLMDGKGGQISGKDFLEVPLAVEIEGMESQVSADRGAALISKTARG
ncbi:hypothetical protein Q3G72_033743 [Acer saccharum]|nr:hypothetical protein Q3G72_033743 [Acer saccharum]